MLQASGSWLERLRPLWVGLFLLALVWAEGRFLLGGLVVMSLLWGWTGFATGIWLRRTPFTIPWLVWLVLIPVTLWATSVPELTHPALRLFMAQAVAFWTFVTWTRTTGRVHWAWGGLIVAGVALAGLSLFWLEWGGRLFAVPAAIRDFGAQRGLPVQELVNKNVMAGILVGLWPLTLAWAVAPWPRRRWLHRVLGTLAALGVLAVLVLSQSRGAWIAAACGLFVLLALRWRILWLGVLLAGGAAILLVQQGHLAPLLTAALQSDALGGLDGRMELWSRALYAIQDFAFTGIGMGAFSRVIPLLYPYFLYGPDVTIIHAHNVWLQVAVDLGLPGLIAFLSMVILTVILTARSLRAFARRGQPVLAWFQRGALAAFSAVLIHGMVDAVTWNTRPAFLIWAVWGVAIGAAMMAAEGESGVLA